MRIERIRWRPFAIPLKQPFGAAHGTIATREGVVLVVETDDGHIGLGEASPLPSYTGGTVTRLLEVLPRFARDFLNDDAVEFGSRASPRRGTGLYGTFGYVPERVQFCLMFAFQVALDSLAAEAAGLPYYRWFAECGSDEDRYLRTVEPSPVIPVNAVIGGGSPQEAATRARQFVARGFETLKVKAGIDELSDVARVAAVREAVGTEVELRIDANGGWSLEEARRVLASIASLHVTIAEQPVAPGPEAFEQLLQLGREFPGVVMAADESLASIPVAFDWHEFVDRSDITLGSVIKPMVIGVGEVLCAMEMADAGKPVIITTTIDAGIGTAAAMHLAAALPLPRPACGLATLDLLEGDIVTGVPQVIDGHVQLPETPGLGIRLDEVALEKYSTGPWQEVRA